MQAQPYSLFIFDHQLIQDLVNYLAQRPYAEVSPFIERIQKSTAVQEDKARAVMSIAQNNFVGAIDLITPLIEVPAPEAPVKKNKA